jgi:hypothetical protein
MIMFGMGAWLCLPICWTWSAAYLIVVTLCNLWFIVRVCPYCAYHGRGDAPSMYCVVANRLTVKGEPHVFLARFRQNLGVMAVLWLLPVVGGLVALRELNDLPYGLTMVAAYGLIAFYLVPKASDCERCLNRDNCPRGMRAKGSAKEAVT